jgi:hypothetical protein
MEKSKVEPAGHGAHIDTRVRNKNLNEVIRSDLKYNCFPSEDSHEQITQEFPSLASLPSVHPDAPPFFQPERVSLFGGAIVD